MDRLSSEATMDAMRHEERTSPKWRLERLISAEARNRALASVYHEAAIVQGRTASSKLIAEHRATRDHHLAVANCIGRRIRREIKRGTL